MRLVHKTIFDLKRGEWYACPTYHPPPLGSKKVLGLPYIRAAIVKPDSNVDNHLTFMLLSKRLVKITCPDLRNQFRRALLFDGEFYRIRAIVMLFVL